jgi:hypothetical protein
MEAPPPPPPRADDELEVFHKFSPSLLLLVRSLSLSLSLSLSRSSSLDAHSLSFPVPDLVSVVCYVGLHVGV